MWNIWTDLKIPIGSKVFNNGDWDLFYTTPLIDAIDDYMSGQVFWKIQKHKNAKLLNFDFR